MKAVIRARGTLTHRPGVEREPGQSYSTLPPTGVPLGDASDLGASIWNSESWAASQTVLPVKLSCT